MSREKLSQIMHMNILRKYLQQQKHTTFRVDQ